MNTHINYADCSALVSRGSFTDYIKKPNLVTSFNETLLQSCQSNICNALWGVGMQISLGSMIIGYFFESIVGFCFVFSLTTLRLLPPKFLRFKPLLEKGCTVFFDSAAFFTVSIQIACMIVLVRRDFGVSANGLGGFTTQITWAIALLSMLPLLCILVVLDTIETTRSGYRFFLFCGCWVLFFYTFVSQMIGDFAPSQMGDEAGEGGTTLITNEE